MEKNEFLIQLGKNIVKLREGQKIRQIDLANMLDIDDSSLRRIESGRTNPTIITLKKIADSLKVKLSDLLDF